MFEGTVTVFDCRNRQNPKFPQNISTPAEVRSSYDVQVRGITAKQNVSSIVLFLER